MLSPAASALGSSGWELTEDLAVVCTLDDGLSYLDLAHINPHGELTSECALAHGRLIASAQDTLSALARLVAWVEARDPGSRLEPVLLAARGAISIATGA